MSRIVMLLALMLLAASPLILSRGDAPDIDASFAIRAEPVPLDARNASRDRVGRLRFLGGWELTSDDPDFGGISGLAFIDATPFVMVTDQGHFLSGTLDLADGAPAGLSGAQIDIIRKEGRPMPEALKAEAEETEPDAGQVLALEQETDVLRDALDRLNPDQRDMIEKAYLGELTHSDIAEATGLPLGTIKSRIRLGLERLRHELKDLR
ncbi:sigma-70 family RNA polymerase sigma factor [uncultured Parasphingopyxis sp.]|uniref:sigma-70 family RNA polymerase sigma factor n=1 Tax=uncultured Parasphingopyxis sp. TaxID=1547918 RepID=UPI00261B6CF9|nr:sigma-70 family RNA polymerase sigma factor [uncultured Parasphingopyxis sp.]